MQLSVQREPGLRVHREEDPGESSTERTRRPAGSGETALAPFLSRECRPSAVSEELLRPGKGPPEEAGEQHSAHRRSRAAPAPTSLGPGGNPQHRGGHGQRPLPPASLKLPVAPEALGGTLERPHLSTVEQQPPGYKLCESFLTHLKSEIQRDQSYPRISLHPGTKLEIVCRNAGKHPAANEIKSTNQSGCTGHSSKREYMTHNE